MSGEIKFIRRGLSLRTNPHEIDIARLHYEVDREKADGEKIWVPEIGLHLSPWAYGQYRGMIDPSMFLQEYEINFGARLGSLVYQLHDEATLEKSFPIPPNWTRYFSLDPHPAVPHAALWGAVDPWGDLWIYRELWPSKQYAKPGPCPDDDYRYPVKHYVEAYYYLESDQNPENEWNGERFNEAVHERVIDYAARAFGKGTSDDPEQPNYQQRFEQKSEEFADEQSVRWSLTFSDAKKDRGVGEDLVNDYLLPREVDDGKDGWRKRSRLHIFADRCPELVYELKNNRRQTLTPLQAERVDPTGKPVMVRKHMTDNLLYMCMANPQYVGLPRPRENRWQPATEGIAY